MAIIKPMRTENDHANFSSIKLIYYFISITQWIWFGGYHFWTRKIENRAKSENWIRILRQTTPRVQFIENVIKSEWKYEWPRDSVNAFVSEIMRTKKGLNYLNERKATATFFSLFPFLSWRQSTRQTDTRRSQNNSYNYYCVYQKDNRFWENLSQSMRSRYANAFLLTTKLRQKQTFHSPHSIASNCSRHHAA